MMPKRLFVILAMLAASGIAVVAHAEVLPITRPPLEPHLPPRGKFGCIDTTGHIVVAAIYRGVRCDGNLIAVANFETGLVDLTGKPVTPLDFDSIGPTIGPDQPLFLSDLEPAKEYGKWGYIGKDGKFVIAPQFGGAGHFGKYGLAPAAIMTKVAKYGGIIDVPKWGFISRSGKFVIAPDFDQVAAFGQNGLAPVQREGQWGYINSSGRVVIPLQFDGAGTFDSSGSADVSIDRTAGVRIDRIWGLLNGNGQYLLKPQMIRITSFSYQNRAIAYRALTDDEHGPSATYLVNRRGQLKALHLAGDPALWGSPVYGLQSFRLNPTPASPARFGYLDMNLRVAIPARFEGAGDFSANGLAPTEENGKYGYINHDGVFVIPPQFQDALPFGAGELAPAEQGGKWGYIDIAGKFSIPPQFDSASEFASNGLARIEVGRPSY